MEHYVTLFDNLFLPQGLALYRSLERHAGSFTLWVLCLDGKTEQTLRSMQLPHMELIALSDVETRELIEVKPGRSRAEYCWTLTPFSPRFVFSRKPDAVRVTYLDADVWLCRSPAPVFAEFEKSGKAVLI